MKNAFLEGERLYLRPLAKADAEGPYANWLNDPEVCRDNSHHVFPYSREMASAFIQAAGDSRSAIVLAVVARENDVHVGNIALQNIHPFYRNAELAILLGDKSIWRKGYGLEASRLLLTHGFSTLGLARVECATFETNRGMISLALSLGMKQEGVRRQAVFKNDTFLDVIEFGLLKGEFAQTFESSGKRL